MAALSRFPVGSSARTTNGSLLNARAIATRCRWPPDSAATLDVLRLFERLHQSGQTLVIVTHDARIAATADRMISMRDGAFVDETRLTGGTTGQLGALVGLED